MRVSYVCMKRDTHKKLFLFNDFFRYIWKHSHSFIHSPFCNSCEHRFSKDCCWCAMFTGRDFLSTLSYVYGRKNHTLFKSNPYHFHRAIDKTTTKNRPSEREKNDQTQEFFLVVPGFLFFNSFFSCAVSVFLDTQFRTYYYKNTLRVLCMCRMKGAEEKNWMKWRRK